MRKIIKNASKVIFSLLLIVSIFWVVNVLAEEVIFKNNKKWYNCEDMILKKEK